MHRQRILAPLAALGFLVMVTAGCGAFGTAATPAPQSSVTPATSGTSVAKTTPEATAAGPSAAQPATSPTAQAPAAAASTAACLVGNWEVQDLTGYYKAAGEQLLPAGAGTFESASGFLRYRFQPDGNVTVNADVTAVARLAAAGNQALNVKVAGEATGRYSATGDALLFTDPGAGGLTLSASLGTTQILPPTQTSGFFGSTATVQSTTKYTCAGNELRLEVTQPIQLPQQTLRRIS